MHDDYDRSSKWLIEHRGDSILRLAGVKDIQSWRALATDVVQPRRLPDGLLEAQLVGQDALTLYLLEIATYPEDRVPIQMLRGTMLVWLDRDILPEVVTLVLCRHGRKRVQKTHSLSSQQAWTNLRFHWRVVELFNLPSEQLLAMNDVGLVPWVPLTKFAGPPEPILQECRRRIDQQAPPNEHENLLVVSQILGRLRYNDRELASIFGGKQAVIKSPLIEEIVQEKRQEDLQRFLAARFGPVPSDLATAIQSVKIEEQLDKLIAWSAQCPDLAAFRARLAPLST